MTASMTRRLLVLAHGGAEGDVAHADGVRAAVSAAYDVLVAGGGALDAAVEAVRLLEDDPRFNAGTGSNLRLDGRSVHMDASVLDSAGRVASVIGLRDVRNPVLVARDLLGTPNRVLVHPGATRFARRMGHPVHDPRTPEARRRVEELRQGRGPFPAGAPREALAASWNYDVPLPAALADGGAPAEADTVGAIAFDGATFAAAGSTGGLMMVLDGRVSDIALPGCGLDAGPHGAVCVSGAGDEIIRARVAARVLRMMEEGASAQEATRRGLGLLPEGLTLAILAIDAQGRGSAAGRRAFPWADARTLSERGA